jgi:hypothetical protein
MTSIEALSFSGDAFSTRGSFEGTAITLLLVGDGNMNAIASLEEVLNHLHAEAYRIHAEVVTLDLANLEFMNSACFKKVLAWIDRVQQMDPSSQYRIRFLSNPKVLWQRRSLHALRCFAVDLITLEA